MHHHWRVFCRSASNWSPLKPCQLCQQTWTVRSPACLNTSKAVVVCWYWTMSSQFCKGEVRPVAIGKDTKGMADSSSASAKASIKVACLLPVEKSHQKWHCWKERRRLRDPSNWEH